MHTWIRGKPEQLRVFRDIGRRHPHLGPVHDRLRCRGCVADRARCR
jgi:hypothetical protein